MAKDITKELMDAIKATLPETQVGLIKEALNERDELRAELKECNRLRDIEIDEKREAVKFTVELENKVKKLQADKQTLKDRNNALEHDNEIYRKKDVERRAELAEGMLAGVLQTQQLFLKNTIVREKVQHQVIDETPSIQYNYVNGQQVPTNVGTNKLHKEVTDVRETVSDVEADESLV